MEELLREEGFVEHAYQDHLGYWTIGIGRLIDKRRGGKITRDEAEYLKRNDIARIREELDAKIPWWRKLSAVRRRAVQNMAFQLGTGDMDGESFDLLRKGKYKEAAARLRGWKWAQQTPARAKRVIKMIETGKA
jgi:lysozyme